jgi:hypothetical protein
MADLRDFTGKNQKFTGTIGEKISPGTTGERDTATYGAGTLRFNTTTNLLEYYTGVEWKSVDAPPGITNFNIDGAGATTSTFIDRTLSGNASIVIQGSLFSAGAIVSFRGNLGANFDATTTTLNSGSQVTAVVPYSSFLAAQEPYTIRVTNLSGLFTQLESCLSVDAKPVFNTASGTLGTITDGGRSSYSLSSAAATDPDGDTITYSITSGALPTGLSFNTSTAAITGTASAVISNTTSTFTVSASTTNQTSTRSFSITVNAPVVTSYTSTGAFTFSVPSGVTAVQALVVAGGGGSAWIGGGGGAGGVVYHSSFPVTPGGTVPGSVGTGGPASPGGNHTAQGRWDGRGGDSTFGSLTAKGGGSTQGWIYQTENPGNLAGGSGAGGSRNVYAGPGIQPSQSNPGATNYGFPGCLGDGPGNPTTGAGLYSGGGGGGAGQAGGHPTTSGPGNTLTSSSGRFGGNGFTSTISGSSVVYGGGGAGSSHTGAFVIGPVPGGTGGGGPATDGAAGSPGTNNRGGGAGGGWYSDFNGGSGGSGIVIVRY